MEQMDTAAVEKRWYFSALNHHDNLGYILGIKYSNLHYLWNNHINK